jgi:hypothetical protein
MTATMAGSLNFNYNDNISIVYICILQLEDNLCSFPRLAQGLRPELSSESQRYRASQTSTTICVIPHM